MDKLKNYVKTVIKDYLKKELPHATLPGAMVAVVTKAEDHYYTLKILDRNLQEDKSFRRSRLWRLMWSVKKASLWWSCSFMAS